MNRPKPKQLSVIKEVIEEAFKKKSVDVELDGPLASILFDYDTTVPKSIGDMRIELEDRGFLLFYSKIVKDGEEYLSINLSKI